MNRVSIALVAFCLVTSHLMAQGVGSSTYDSRAAVARTTSERALGPWLNVNGGVCYPAPFYENCSYDSAYYALTAYRLWTFSNLLNSTLDAGPPRRVKVDQ